jgi:hypothetical protein
MNDATPRTKKSNNMINGTSLIIESSLLIKVPSTMGFNKAGSNGSVAAVTAMARMDIENTCQ